MKISFLEIYVCLVGAFVLRLLIKDNLLYLLSCGALGFVLGMMRSQNVE